jgi:hypothetical protein
MRDQTKLCINCKHRVPDTVFNMCGGLVDLVTGRRVKLTAITMRAKKGECGPEGKLFEEATKAVKRKERY